VQRVSEECRGPLSLRSALLVEELGVVSGASFDEGGHECACGLKARTAAIAALLQQSPAESASQSTKNPVSGVLIGVNW
jgi:hypothetical protein